MGKGNGGYDTIQDVYRDTGGHKVTDPGAKFVAERYIDLGYVVVFRQRHEDKTPDLTVKDSSDTQIIKHIEVKQITSTNPSKTAKRIKEAFEQVGDDGTVALDFSRQPKSAAQRIAAEGFAEAKRKGHIKGKVEIWYKDKTKEELN